MSQYFKGSSQNIGAMRTMNLMHMSRKTQLGRRTKMAKGGKVVVISGLKLDKQKEKHLEYRNAHYPGAFQLVI